MKTRMDELIVYINEIELSISEKQLSREGALQLGYDITPQNSNVFALILKLIWGRQQVTLSIPSKNIKVRAAIHSIVRNGDWIYGDVEIDPVNATYVRAVIEFDMSSDQSQNLLAEL